MTLILIFIFGLIIGSFLNAVIYRLHANESFLFTRSHCPYCKHELTAIDLIPLVSFILLRGRCRYCGRKISWQYPLVELTTGIIFVLFAMNYGLRITDYGFWLELIFASILVVIGIFDLKYYLILDKVVFPALALATIWNIWQDATTHYSLLTTHFVSGLFGALIVSGFFGLQYFISKGRWIGFGDVKLGLFLGSLLGSKLSVIMLILAYFTGALVGVGLILSGKKTLSSKLPFGVFLAFSAILTLLYGSGIANWYFKLIGF